MRKNRAHIQIRVSDYDGRIEQTQNRHNYALYRKMRRQPTIALAREYSIAPILASSWSYKGDDEQKVEFIKSQIQPWRQYFLSTCLYGEIDFGWKAYEKKFKYERTKQFGMRQCLHRLNALWNDNTEALYERETGDFAGLFQTDLNDSQEVWIDKEHSLFVNFDEEGLGAYGEARLSRLQETYEAYKASSNAAKRYDNKLAGSHWIIYYPTGNTEYGNRGEIDNAEIAADILNKLEASGCVSIPLRVRNTMDELNSEEGSFGGWKIELMQGGSQAGDFVSRLSYLDTQFVRGMGITERSITEGNYGTKAEAQEHGNASLIVMQLRHEYVTNHINWYVVEPLLRNNWGPDSIGDVEVVANPLSDEKTVIYNQIFSSLLSNEATVTEVLDYVDMPELFDHLKVPIRSIGGVRPIDGR